MSEQSYLTHICDNSTPTTYLIHRHVSDPSAS